MAGVLAVGVLAMSCSQQRDAAPTSDGRSATSVASGVTTRSSDVPVASTIDSIASTTTPSSEVDEWALDYTGGRLGAASGKPVTVGYVNDEDRFPENTIGIAAAVAYVNAELGGADGRPVVIVPCRVTIAEDGGRCGAMFADDPDIVAVVTGTILSGNAELYDALDGRKPVIVGNGITSDDATTTAGQTFNAGAPGLITGMAEFVVQELGGVESVAILSQEGAAGRAAADLLIGPVLDDAGITRTDVAVPDTGSVADVQSALLAARAEDVDVFVTLLTVQQCITIHDVVRALGIAPAVVTTGLCSTAPMGEHLREVGRRGPVPDGWYVAGYGYSVFLPDLDSGMATYVAAIEEYGTPAPAGAAVELAGFAGPSFANILTLVRFINELGADALSGDALDAAIRGFTGPMMLQVGPLSCGDVRILDLPVFPTPCASQVGIQQYLDGEWISIRDGLNGNPIDLSSPLRP